LEAKAHGLAGFKGYITNIDNPTPELVIDAYHRLFNIEKSFRMSKHDLRVRPIYHHKRESIGAPHHRVRRSRGHPAHRRPHRLVDQEVRAHRPPLPTIGIRAGQHTLTAEHPPDIAFCAHASHVHRRARPLEAALS
jgi:hypothetical protein